MCVFLSSVDPSWYERTQKVRRKISLDTPGVGDTSVQEVLCWCTGKRDVVRGLRSRLFTHLIVT